MRKHYVGKNVFGADAKECRVTSKYGTDFIYRVDDKIWIPPLPSPEFDPFKIINFQKDENRPAGKLYYYLYPTGEFNVAPIEGTRMANSSSTSPCTIWASVSSPIELTVEKGRVVKIEGGVDARVLRDFLETYGDENAYMCPAGLRGR